MNNLEAKLSMTTLTKNKSSINTKSKVQEIFDTFNQELQKNSIEQNNLVKLMNEIQKNEQVAEQELEFLSQKFVKTIHDLKREIDDKNQKIQQQDAFIKKQEEKFRRTSLDPRVITDFKSELAQVKRQFMQENAFAELFRFVSKFTSQILVKYQSCYNELQSTKPIGDLQFLVEALKRQIEELKSEQQSLVAQLNQQAAAIKDVIYYSGYRNEGISVLQASQLATDRYVDISDRYQSLIQQNDDLKFQMRQISEENEYLKAENGKFQRILQTNQIRSPREQSASTFGINPDLIRSDHLEELRTRNEQLEAQNFKQTQYQQLLVHEIECLQREVNQCKIRQQNMKFSQ